MISSVKSKSETKSVSKIKTLNTSVRIPRTPKTTVPRSNTISGNLVGKKNMQTPTPVSRQARKLHNCFPPETPRSSKLQTTGCPPLGKSVSLVDLSVKPKPLRKWHSKEQVDGARVPDGHIQGLDQEYFGLESGRQRQLAQKVCKTLVLAAWRRARSQGKSLQQLKQRLEKDVDRLNLQVIVLKELLESEKTRTTKAVDHAFHLKHRLETQVKVEIELKEKIHALQLDQENWERKECELCAKFANLESELNSKTESLDELTKTCSNFESEMEEYKQKSGLLMRKLEDAECDVKSKNESIQNLKQNLSDKQKRFNEIMSKNLALTSVIANKEKQMHEYVIKIETMNGELSNLKNEVKEQNRKIVDLKMEVTNGNNELREYEESIQKLEETILNFDQEKKKIKNQVINVLLNVGTVAMKFLPSPHIQ